MPPLDSPDYWAVVPAAGVGRRMGAPTPKQYLPLAGGTVIEHTLDRITRATGIRGVVVALAPEDPWWPKLSLRRHGAWDAPIFEALGGEARCHSVQNALVRLTDPAIGARENDWVLVHDAARPCVHPDDVRLLITTLRRHPVGGLLGHRVRDTMKRADMQGDVDTTLDRRNVWHALTPQMFRLGPLTRALAHCRAQDVVVTDEAEAMERAGFTPRLVEGRPDNVKVTRPEDLTLAAFYLRRQRSEAGNGIGDPLDEGTVRIRPPR